MIATIVGTAVASVTIITTRPRRNTSSKVFTRKVKEGAWRLPLSLFFFVVPEAR
jgi:hypothetical protein